MTSVAEWTSLPTAIDAAWATIDSDGIGLEYMSQSLKPALGADEKQACMKFALAEDMINKGEAGDAWHIAEEALSCFQRVDRTGRGAADSLRLLVHLRRLEIEGMRQQNNTDAMKQAWKTLDDTITTNRTEFQRQGFKQGEAAMLLSEAEASFNKRGPKKREIASSFAEHALFLSQDIVDRPLEAIAELVLGHIFIKSGPVESALQHCGQALSIYRDLDNKRGVARANVAMSLALAANGKYGEAIQAASEAVSLFKGLAAGKLQAMSLYILSRWHLMQKEMHQSAKEAEEAVQLFIDFKADKGWVLAAESLCAVAKNHAASKGGAGKEAKGKRAAASARASATAKLEARCLDPALQVAQQYQLDYHDAVLEYLDGPSADRKGTPSKQEIRQFMESAKDSEEAAKDSGDKAGQARASFMIACAYRWADNYNAAVRNARVSQALYRAVNDKANEWRTLCWLTSLHMINDHPKEANRTVKEAFRASRYISEMVRTDTLLLVARVFFDSLVSAADKSLEPRHVLQTQGEPAFMAATESAEFARAADDKYRLASALLVSGQVAFSIMKADIALAAINEAMPIFKELQDKAQEAASRLLEAELHSFNGRYDNAYGAATLAKSLAKSGVHPKVEQRALLLIQKAPPKPEVSLLGAVGASKAGYIAVPSQIGDGLDDSPRKGANESAVKGLQLDDVKAMMLKFSAEIMSGEDEIGFDGNLMDQGLDSLSALSFRNNLKERTGLKLPGTLMYDYPTMREVALHIVDLARSSRA